MQLPLDLESRVAVHRQRLLAEAEAEQLAQQIRRRRSSRIASRLAGLLYGLAARLDQPAAPSLGEQPRGLITG